MLTSASSKTAIGLAHLLHSARKDIKVIGLTSKANAGFVGSLGYYDEVVIYDNIEGMPSDEPVALVDMAGYISVQGGRVELKAATVKDAVEIQERFGATLTSVATTTNPSWAIAAPGCRMTPTRSNPSPPRLSQCAADTSAASTLKPSESNAVTPSEKLNGLSFAASRTFSSATTWFRGIPTSVAYFLVPMT